MNKEERLELENELLMSCSKAQAINKYIDELEENQQKEFINYMNDIIDVLKKEDVDDEELRDYIIQRIDTFKEILQKYKEITGGK